MSLFSSYPGTKLVTSMWPGFSATFFGPFWTGGHNNEGWIITKGRCRSVCNNSLVLLHLQLATGGTAGTATGGSRSSRALRDPSPAQHHAAAQRARHLNLNKKEIAKNLLFCSNSSDKTASVLSVPSSHCTLHTACLHSMPGENGQKSNKTFLASDHRCNGCTQMEQTFKTR